MNNWIVVSNPLIYFLVYRGHFIMSAHSDIYVTQRQISVALTETDDAVGFHNDIFAGGRDVDVFHVFTEHTIVFAVNRKIYRILYISINLLGVGVTRLHNRMSLYDNLWWTTCTPAISVHRVVVDHSPSLADAVCFFLLELPEYVSHRALNCEFVSLKYMSV